MYINKQSNIQKKDLVSTKTASGNPIVITDCAGGKARSLKTTINAIQDLHGYDHPWAGGAGKNKAFFPDSFTLNGITFSKRSDGSVVINGTCTTSFGTMEYIDGFEVQSGTYTLSCANPLPANVWLSVSNLNPTMINPAGMSKTFTLESGTYKVHIFITAGVSFNNYVFNPQLESGSTATAYASYSNICPINGRDSVTITVEEVEE